MRTQELNNVIEKLKESSPEANAFLGFHQYGGDEDESMIKANKEGLRLYAASLLMASVELEKRDFKSREELFSLHTDWVSENSDFYFAFVEFFQQSKSEIEPIVEYEKTRKDSILEYIFKGFLIFILISILVGAITIISWVF